MLSLDISIATRGESAAMASELRCYGGPVRAAEVMPSADLSTGRTMIRGGGAAAIG